MNAARQQSENLLREASGGHVITHENDDEDATASSAPFPLGNGGFVPTSIQPAAPSDAPSSFSSNFRLDSRRDPRLAFSSFGSGSQLPASGSAGLPKDNLLFADNRTDNGTDDGDENDASPSLLIQLESLPASKFATSPKSFVGRQNPEANISSSYLRPFQGFGIAESVSPRRFNYAPIPISEPPQQTLPHDRFGRDAQHIPIRSSVSVPSRKDLAWKVWDNVDNLDVFL
ncbi:hypothetical protein HK096_009697, partial [Nowakowskiella sp. JEL0078]